MKGVLQMDINKIKELAEVYLQEQVDLLMRFTSVDSESNYVEGNRQVIDMAGLSLKPSRCDNGRNVL